MNNCLRPYTIIIVVAVVLEVGGLGGCCWFIIVVVEGVGFFEMIEAFRIIIVIIKLVREFMDGRTWIHPYLYW